MRCGATSLLAGESLVERVLDGGGVPLMRERAKEGTNSARILRTITLIYWITTEHLSRVSSSTECGEFSRDTGPQLVVVRMIVG